jgi:hypothetical protein
MTLIEKLFLKPTSCEARGLFLEMPGGHLLIDLQPQASGRSGRPSGLQMVLRLRWLRSPTGRDPRAVYNPPMSSTGTTTEALAGSIERVTFHNPDSRPANGRPDAHRA